MNDVIEIIEDDTMSLLDCCKTKMTCEYSDVKRQIAYVDLFFERAYVEFQKSCEVLSKNKCESSYVNEIVKKYMKYFRTEIENQMDREAEQVVFDIQIDYELLFMLYPELMKYNEIKKATEFNCNRRIKLYNKPAKSEYLSMYECHPYVQDCSLKTVKLRKPATIPSKFGRMYGFGDFDVDDYEDYKSNVNFVAGYDYLSLENDLHILEKVLNVTLMDNGKHLNQKIDKCKEYFENGLYIRSILQNYFRDCVSIGEREAEAQIKICLTEVKNTIFSALNASV